MIQPGSHSRAPSAGSDGSMIRAFQNDVHKDHPMAIPHTCVCVWVVRANRIWVLKFESAICPHKGNH